MKYSTRLSDAVHVLVFIELNQDSDLRSTAIATSIATNPGFVRQLMMAMRRAGLLQSVAGHARPRLAREPAEISLLDVYRAVEGDKPLLHLDTHTNPECGVGVNIQLALREHFDTVQAAADRSMAAITLQDVIDDYAARVASPARRGKPVAGTAQAG